MIRINSSIHSVEAFAPATCANVAIGFDILGFAFSDVGDTVKLTRRDDDQIVMESISVMNKNDKIPCDSDKNVASIVIGKVCEALKLNAGFSIHLQKGIPLSSGMGGSAASAVAALVALNAFLDNRLTLHELANYALCGEEAASGQKHPDNIVPCLFGGLTLVHSMDPMEVIQLPLPDIFCVLIHPHLHVETRDARSILKPELPMKDFVRQSANLAAFISALYQNDISLLKKTMKDYLIESQRAHFVPGFHQIQKAALDSGALAASFSGSGPSVFALANNHQDAEIIKTAMQNELKSRDINSDHWIAKISSQGARVTTVVIPRRFMPRDLHLIRRSLDEERLGMTMHYISTRNSSVKKSLSDAILSGLASDDGLFIPESIPEIDLKNLNRLQSYPDFCHQILMKYFSGDLLENQLKDICQNAFNFPVPMNRMNENTYMLELYHGPTLSFKDIGARFLSQCMQKISLSRKHTILLATSGDTGSAVASALYRQPNINVIILYPKGKISPRQEQQITCWGENILSLAVNGTFDDCQFLVKSAFNDERWKENFSLSSANSINIGRLLPQISYYAYSSMEFYQRYHLHPGYIIPTGNLGNATAAYLAKLMGFPIREIVLSTNANKIIPDYLKSGNYHPRPSIQTLANAMDVGNPNNFERLSYWFNSISSFRENVNAYSVCDDEIKKTIITTHQQSGKIICPHTATAFHVRNRLSDQPWIIVSTAHPAKFDTVIEPLIREKIAIPEQLKRLLERKISIIEVEKNLSDVRLQAEKYFA